MERIPAAPPIFKKLMWINYLACAGTVIYGIVTLQPSLIAVGAIGLVTFGILSKLGGA